MRRAVTSLGDSRSYLRVAAEDAKGGTPRTQGPPSSSWQRTGK